jgi:hypothetical protein
MTHPSNEVPTMNFLSLLSWSTPHRLHVLLHSGCRDAKRSAAVHAQEDAERPVGCGWFESSHELHRGLVVREHATPDALGAELPLASWLELHLTPWRGGGSMQDFAAATEASCRARAWRREDTDSKPERRASTQH